jgi:hypothetical protein
MLQTFKELFDGKLGTFWYEKIKLYLKNGAYPIFCKMNNITKMYNIKHIFTPPYHPKSNGLAENVVRNFKNGLNIILNENTTDLETAMARYLLAYSTAPHATTKTSPAEMMFGRKLRIRLDNVKPPTVTTSAINNPNKASSGEFATGETVMIRDYTNPHKLSWRKGEVKKRIGRHVCIHREHKHNQRRQFNNLETPRCADSANKKTIQMTRRHHAFNSS